MNLHSLTRALTWFAFFCVVLGLVYLDLNRDIWLVKALPLSQWADYFPIRTSSRYSGVPVMLNVPRWEVTIIGAGVFVFAARKMGARLVGMAAFAWGLLPSSVLCIVYIWSTASRTIIGSPSGGSLSWAF